MTARKYGMEFRRDEVEYVMRAWSAGVSCSLIGIGSVGKSNLLQHLVDPNVQTHFIREPSLHIKPIIIDANMLGALPGITPENEAFRCWAGYELMMHRLFMTFYPFDLLGADDAERFYETYQALQNGNNPLFSYMGLRYFELGLEFFMRHDVRIVFLFDEFEELLRQLPAKFFQSLRGLRDSHKRQIMYLSFTRAPLPVLVERLDVAANEIEPFVELFTDNTYYVGHYNEADARQMVGELAQRQQKDYPPSVIHALLQSTGRYAGLLRAGFSALDTFTTTDLNAQTAESLGQFLLTRNSIRAECHTIWESLTPAEHYVLRAVARLAPYNVSPETEQIVFMLMQKRLLRLDKSNKRLEIEPPIFREFIATNPSD